MEAEDGIRSTGTQGCGIPTSTPYSVHVMVSLAIEQWPHVQLECTGTHSRHLMSKDKVDGR